ncbi:MAG TPA: aminotransferase class I/II-fold pyridoxal phosphate-dependent enzyme [Vicinamibacteria bacterium]|nr:aminotransferase class I/II-fold pyridoxal phosphate-dependent enzyme [Vicinamibacteria bacterium]
MSQATATPSLESLARISGSAPRMASLADKLQPSTILKVAGEIKAMLAAGRDVCDLTVGDFDPKHFPIPEKLRDLTKAALDAGATNYPPSNGIPALRESVQRFYARHLGLNYPVDSVLIAAGARPLIYALFRIVVEPGDTVSFPVPCWNYPFYAEILGAHGDAVLCSPEDAFQPRPGALEAAIKKASLLIVNTPLNPAGTVTPRAAVLKLSEDIVRENEAREKSGRRPVYLMYDHIYWMLSFGVEHVTPCALVPEMAKYTIFIDGISKGFASTGLRVGWAVGPTDVIGKMNTLLMHMGGWAPKPEQTASAQMLDDDDAIAKFHAVFKPALGRRLVALHQGFQKLKAEGHPVDSIEPTGAIYVSARVHPFGRRAANGAEIRTNEDVRTFLLEAAGLGVVPFQAFGVPGETGWMRLSVGAVSEAQIESGLARLGAALRALV